MKEINIRQQWEEKENILPKKKYTKPRKDGKWIITGETETGLIKRTKNGITKIKDPRGGFTIFDLTGQKFNRLTALKYIGKDKFNNTLWKCQCDCGKIKIVGAHHLKSGKVKSCSCLQREMSSKAHKGNTYRRINKGESGLNSLFTQYIRSAKIRNLKFNLTKEQFKKLTLQNCYYCGLEPLQIQYSNSISKHEWSKYIYNGIDRKDNLKGYVIENCVPCCKFCNRMKMNISYSEFFEHIYKIINYHGTYI